jgi:HlyD family secretion protein
MVHMKKASWITLLVVALVGAGAYVWWSKRDSGAAAAYKTGKIERGALQATVSASGTVNPVKQVSVGTQVSGQLKDVYADFNTEVRAGQLIAQIDSETFEYRVRSAQADVEAARANVLTAQANAVASQANVSRARTDLIEAQRTHQRNVGLVAQGFIAQSETDKSAALVASAQEALKSAQAQLGVTEAQIKTAEATVAQRQAVLSQAGVDLGRTSIKSPVDGIVIKRAVERGQTVAASLQSPELFVIAQNLSDMQVDASIDEADVGRIRTGQKATFTVDAFPGQTFEGDVRQVRKAAQNVANVVTYIAVVGFQNSAGRLLPGMTANVRIVTDQRDDVLKVPNAALRVRIPGVEPVTATPADGQPGAAAGATGAAAGAPPAGAAPSGSGGAGGSGGPSGAATEFRNRLVTELKLSPEQVEKVDAVYAETRPRFGALRDLPAEERPKARERLMGDIRARIAAVLTPEQKTRYAMLVAESAGRQSTRGRVYLLGADGKPVAYNVRLGISDGSSTELLMGPNAPDAQAFEVGATVVTGLPTTANPNKPPAGGPRPLF